MTFTLRTPPPSRPTGGSSLYRNLSMPASTPRPTLTVKMMEQGSQKTTGGGSLAARSGSGAKEMILMWVQNRIKDYPVKTWYELILTFDPFLYLYLIISLKLYHPSSSWRGEVKSVSKNIFWDRHPVSVTYNITKIFGHTTSKDLLSITFKIFSWNPTESSVQGTPLNSIN